VLDEFAMKLRRVVITELHDGTFYAEIEVGGNNGDESGVRRISSRPSDALALAARYPDQVPIYADEAVLDEAGVLFDQDEEETQIEEFREFLNQVSPEDFAAGEGPPPPST
jgi:bifunctional DNase/RNase